MTIKQSFCFDCKCDVCSGKVDGQENILKELLELHNNLDPDTYSKKKLSIYVKAIDKMVDLSLQLYIGSLEDKVRALEMMAETAYQNQDEDRLEKAEMQLKKIADDTKLKCLTEFQV